MTVPLLVIGLAIAMLGVERVRPGRRWPRVAGWWPRALGLSALQAGAVWLAGVAWDPWLAAHRPWSAEWLGPVAGAALGYLVITFVYYWWHRARHEVPFLWRWLHQVHHSPRRLETLTTFYKHPLEILANGVLSSALLYGVVGLAPGRRRSPCCSRVWPSSSTTGTCPRPTGWASSCSARRATASTTRRGTTP